MGIFYGDYKGGDDAFRYYAGIVWDQPVRPAEGIEVHEVAGGNQSAIFASPPETYIRSNLFGRSRAVTFARAGRSRSRRRGKESIKLR